MRKKCIADGQFSGPARNHGLIIHAAIFDERNCRELIDHEFRVSRPGIAQASHFVQMVILEADRVLRIVGHPARVCKGWA